MCRCRPRAALVGRLLLLLLGACASGRVLLARAALDAAGHCAAAAELAALVDRAPDVRRIAIVLMRAGGPREVLASALAPSGMRGRRGCFVTPLRVFVHDGGSLGCRALGTPNGLGIRGRGAGGLRVWDFGWQLAERAAEPVPPACDGSVRAGAAPRGAWIAGLCPDRGSDETLPGPEWGAGCRAGAAGGNRSGDGRPAVARASADAAGGPVAHRRRWRAGRGAGAPLRYAALRSASQSRALWQARSSSA